MMMEEPTLSSSNSTYNSSHFPLIQHPSLAFDLNNQDEYEEEGLIIPKEPLFEKPLTPSDVGKLNRLVIPKQHAEKHFPINQIIDSGEKGLILSFEDELGKLWRFRYSYWNSSQSYVLTKGWSRFVKEKRLDAGDVVLFERHRTDGDRHFIGWRRRRGTESGGGQGAGGGGWRGVLVKGQSYLTQSPLGGPAAPYQPHPFHAAFQSRTRSPTANPKTLRLFGVNMQCHPEMDDSGSSASTHGSSSYPNFYQYCYPNSETYNHYTYKDINFASEADQMEYHQE